MKTAIVTGITGQDGAYLAELLLYKGYTVYGTFRRTSSVNFWRIEELGIESHPNLHLVEHDLTDLSASIRLLERPGRAKFITLPPKALSACRLISRLPRRKSPASVRCTLLEAIRIVDPTIRFYQASTSEMFGLVQAVPQTKRRLSIREAPMASPSSMPTG